MGSHCKFAIEPPGFISHKLGLEAYESIPCNSRESNSEPHIGEQISWKASPDFWMQGPPLKTAKNRKWQITLKHRNTHSVHTMNNSPLGNPRVEPQNPAGASRWYD